MRYLQYVNVKQGSASVMRFSHGNTLPLTQRPFAMAAFAPQTDGSSSWYYHPSHRSFEGIRLTHQPSPWIGDYGSFVILPQKFEPKFGRDARWSGFRPEDAVLMPHYMKIEPLRSRSLIELTPSERGGWFRVKFRDEKENWLSVLPVSGRFDARFDPAENRLYFTVNNTNDEHVKNFRMYVVISFLRGLSADEPVIGTDKKSKRAYAVSGEDAGIHLPVAGDAVEGQIATSYISFEQALENARQDFEGETFESLLKNNEEAWEEKLSRVEIETDDPDQMKTFYSCMYRAFLYPHKCYEIDRAGKPVHFAPMNGAVKPGVRYTDNGFWDTYRTVYPFFAIAAKDEYREMCEGYINDYRDCGWLPRWPAMGERGCMPSTLIDATLCDAAVKGILTGEPLRKAFEGMLKHANKNAPNDDFGRSGCEEYVRLGYVPIEAHRESVNLTLDAAYGDWCIAVIARLLGEEAIAEEYEKRAKNYRNLFDPETGFMRARFRDGSFRPDFSPTGWGRDYTEGSAWQNSFAVPHDPEGLASLYGSKEAFFKKVDELFAAEPDYEVVGYGGEIHEMTEMAAVDFGQCAISNQPSFHLPFLYGVLGDTERSSYWTEKLCREAFSWRDDGFPGDEDNGTTALWYVFATIGIYPFCPGKNEYVRTKKLVKSVKIRGVEFDADAFSSNLIPYDVFREI
ncbi:MAG: GH92 family glycosyl hydrolase [Clostridia bacterium]|nr:GH92 family glycosyl hydrolase [Clostridia bacterium]